MPPYLDPVAPDRKRQLSTEGKRIVKICAIIALILVAGALLARPASRRIKSWQAHRHATKAFALIDAQKWDQARDEAVAAYRLRPNDRESLRALARYLSRAQQPQAFEFWDQLRSRFTPDQQDLRDEAALALAESDIDRATAAVQSLIDQKTGKTIDWFLAAQVALRKNDGAAAVREVEKILASPAAVPREKLQALMVELAIGGDDPASRERQGKALAQLETLAAGKDDVALDALAVLAQQTLATPPNSAPAGDNPARTKIPAGELIRMLREHPLSKTPQKLLALDLELHEDPAQRPAILDRAVTEFASGDTETLVSLAAWLNRKGEYKRHLDNIPVQRATQSRDLFLQRLDALGAIADWEEIKHLLESEQYPLEVVTQRMYLARCSIQLGQTAAAENNWRRAMEAAGGDPAKLIALGEYAEKNGARDVARDAYDEAAAQAPKFRRAHQGRLRIAKAAGDTAKMQKILEDMLKFWPADPAVQNDEAYTRLLLSPPDAPAAEAQLPVESIADQLVKRFPASLPHRTLLALALLKQNRPVAALQVYEGLNVDPHVVSPGALAVHAAVVAANGDVESARTEAGRVRPDQLLPEERALIQPLL